MNADLREISALPGPVSRWGLAGGSLPAVGAAILPKLTCPVCWPAYAGFLSSLGVGFFDYTPYLVPLTGAFLVIALAALAYRAPRRRGYKPFMIGLLAAGLVMAGKFGMGSDLVMFAGLSLLVAASLWNSWPQQAAGESCAACLDREPQR